MNDGLFDIGEPLPEGTSEKRTAMTQVQRQMIRELFAQMNVTDARDQFRIVADLTGVRINSVSELEVTPANVLIRQLKSHVTRAGRGNTGNAWADREDETWIDRL